MAEPHATVGGAPSPSPLPPTPGAPTATPSGTVATPRPVLAFAVTPLLRPSSGAKPGTPAMATPGRRVALVRSAAAADDDDGDDDDDNHGGKDGKKELIVALDETGAKTASDVTARKPLVIPLIETNYWRNSPTPASTIASKPATPQLETVASSTDVATATTSATQTAVVAPQAKRPRTEDEEALAVLQAEAAAAAGKTLEGAEKVTVLPLLARNQPPGIETLSTEAEKFKHDVSMRPDESTLEDYVNVPVEDFGQALLRGMGWTEGKGIGRNNNGLISPIEFVPRQDRLGLGATPRPIEEIADDAKRKRIPKPGESTTPKPVMVAPPGPDGKVRHYKTIDEKLVPLSSVKRSESRSESRSTAPTTWLHPGLRVRIVSQKWKDGSHYNRKTIIEAVQDPNGKRSSSSAASATANLRTEEGFLLNDVPENILETIVPKPGGRVKVLRGKHRGRLAEVVEKDSKRGQDGEASLKFSDRDGGSQWISYNDICEYVS